MAIDWINFFGLKLSVFTDNQLLDYIKYAISHKEKTVCYGYSFGTLPYFKKYPEIAIYSNRFEVSLCDGRGLYLLAKILGYNLKSDLSIPNLSRNALELADKEGFSLMLLGSSKENNLRATENIRKKYPKAIIYDGYDGGWFNLNDQLKSVEIINQKKPDILFIGVSCPKKESFAYTWKDKLDVSVIIPFGGGIDILSGRSKPIPKPIKKLMLGALWRFFQEPKRLFRDSIINSFNTLFLMIPSLLFNHYIMRKEFSIPKFYNKSCEAPIV
jgi:N-acetylglucosaminyldiphosphoundecaprenol N-acetyl-beta-D-mannosaminyltransferase